MVTVKEFFSGRYESDINEDSLYRNYIWPKSEILNYVEELLNIPVCDYVRYLISEYKEPEISSKDIFMFSSIYAATDGIVDVLLKADNPGANYILVGKLLLDDGKERKKGALLKYGENHSKTGAALGLLFELDNTYFISCLGAVWNDLNSEQKHKLLVRTLLRDNLIKKLIFMSEHQDIISMRYLFNCLSDSSFGRRKSNVQKILKILYTSEEYNFKNIIDKCNWNMQIK